MKTDSTGQARWLAMLRDAVAEGRFTRLTLGSPCGPDATLQKLLVRPVVLRAGERLCFVFRHTTRDITKNLAHEDGLARIEKLLGAEFRSATLFATDRTIQLEIREGRSPRLIEGKPAGTQGASIRHDRAKRRWIEAENTPWLHALGVTNADGRITKGMEAKFRQINRFVELLETLLDNPGLKTPVGQPPGSPQPGTLEPKAVANPVACAPIPPPSAPFTLVDMGCGKGYLTFAAADWLQRSYWPDAEVRGIEARPELVDLCNRVAREAGFDRLRFEKGVITAAPSGRIDVLVALHACDTATDDAIARGVEAGASLMLVAPCCHQELRPQLRAPPALAGAFKHGILRERQAEFVTDALRAALLEWAGYDTKVFEFVSTEHTAKNLMIAAVKRTRADSRKDRERQPGDLAAFYGIQSQRLAQHLGFDLSGAKS